jgi:hypothetical protein
VTRDEHRKDSHAPERAEASLQADVKMKYTVDDGDQGDLDQMVSGENEGKSDEEAARGNAEPPDHRLILLRCRCCSSNSLAIADREMHTLVVCAGQACPQ